MWQPHVAINSFTELSRVHDSIVVNLNRCLNANNIKSRADINASLRNTVRSTTSNKRPDITIHNADPSDSDAHIDVTTRTATNHKYVARAATTPGTAADDGDQAKLDAWHQLYANQGDRFIPITVEDGGYFSDGFYTLIDLALQGAGGT